MARRLPLVVAITLWFLVAWYWVAWPGLGYLQARDVLGGVSSWDIWRSLIAGPLDGDTLPLDPSGYQYVLFYGNWLFGYALLGIALSTAGRVFNEKAHNLIHLASYVVLGVVATAFLVFGSSQATGSSVFEGEAGQASVTENVVVDEVSTTTVAATWSYGFKALQDQLLTNVKTGTGYLLSSGGEFQLYTKWAELGSLAARSFEAANDDVLGLLLMLDDESRPSSVKDSFAFGAGQLRQALQSAIKSSEDLSRCARTSQKDGDCDAALDLLLSSARNVGNSSVAVVR